MRLWNDRHLSLSITRLGLEFVGMTVVVGLFGVQSGNNLFYVLFSLMVGLFLVSGWVSLRALKGVRPLRIEEGNIFVRVRGGIRVWLEDRVPKRPRALVVSLSMQDGTVERGFYPAGQERTDAVRIALHVIPKTRGWHALQELTLSTVYPFGFMEKTVRFPLDQSVLVLPHPRVSRSTRGGLGAEAHMVPRPGSASPDLARPFRPGDSPRRVHWKRTAQRGEPWVRTFEDERPLGIRLELDLGLWQPGPKFEKELERLSGMILQARIQRLHVTLVLFGRHGRKVFDGATPAWRALATAEAQDVPGPAETHPGR